MIAVTWGAASDTGRVRACNEDAVLAQSPMFVVADGMGGHAGGATASRIAVETFRQLLDLPSVCPADIPQQIQAANEAIRTRAGLDPDASTMGTTAVGLALLSEGGQEYWLAFNIGDSRLYRMHDRVLRQISVDHSYVQELVLAGFIAPEEARRHPERSLITRALGGPDDAEPDFWVFPAEPGERYLLCSDGLSGELDDDAIAELLAAAQGAQQIADTLVRRANEAGGRDNISAVVVDVAGTRSADVDAPTGDRPTGNRPTGNRPTGNRPTAVPAAPPDGPPGSP